MLLNFIGDIKIKRYNSPQGAKYLAEKIGHEIACDVCENQSTQNKHWVNACMNEKSKIINDITIYRCISFIPAEVIIDYPIEEVKFALQKR